MFKRILAFLALAFVLFGTRCWAQEFGCSGEGTVSCSFGPTHTTNTYEFGDDGRLIVQFDTVLTNFTLDVKVTHVIDAFDPKEFPTGTVCVRYAFNTGLCDQYDFSGFSGGPNGVPVKNKDYKGLITLTLSYVNLNSQTIRNPAFGHAPGDITTFTEDILTSYSSSPSNDPTMTGKTPGLSSVAALDEPLSETDTFCSFESAPLEGNSLQEADEIEVAFRLVAGANNSTSCIYPTGIRDKTARFSVWTTDSNGNVVFPQLQVKEEGNKFHWDSRNGVNELDLSKEGLPAGDYTITVFSSKFSPQDTFFTVAP